MEDQGKDGEDDINEVLKQVVEETENLTGNSNQINKTWINTAKDRGRWTLLKEIYTMTSRSMHTSSEIIEGMVSELEGYRWDAILLSETWRHEQAEKWETHHKHIFMGSGKFDNKHGVRSMLNKRWRQRIIDTEYIDERAITTTILVNRQRIILMSVCFFTRGVGTITLRKCTKRSRNARQIAKDTYTLLEETSMQNWDLDTKQNVLVLAGTHSTRETKEVIG